MADEEQFIDDDVTGDDEAAAGTKAGFLPSVLITILKWAAIGLGVIILVATVSWATFRLFIRGREQPLPVFSPEYEATQLDLQYFKNNLDNIRGQTADDPPKSFLAAVSVGYRQGDTTMQNELNEKTEQIQNAILIYLGNRSATELTTKNIPSLQEDIKRILNNQIVRTGQIDSVLFSELQTF